MKNSIRSGALTTACFIFFCASAVGERLDLGEGLTINQPEASSITFQPIPSYNASKKMLLRRSDDKLKYFINIDRLPRGTNNADRYFERLLRDVSDTSTADSLQVINQGQYLSENNVQGAYIEYLFIPVGATKAQHHIAHFLTNSYRTFIATAVLLDSASEQIMRDDAITLFQSAAISTANTSIKKADSAEK